MSFFLRYLKYVRPYTLQVLLSVLCSLLFIVFSAISFWIAADVVQSLFLGMRVETAMPQGILSPATFIDYLKYYSSHFIFLGDPLHSLQRAILLLLLAFLLKNLALYGQYFLTTFIEQQITMTMRKQYYARLMDQDLAYFFHRKSGELMSIGINDITALNTGLAESFNKLIRDPFTVIVFLILLLGISWQLTLAALVIAPITGLISSVVSFSLKRKSRRAQEKLGMVTSRLHDILYGMRIVQAYGGEEYERQRLREATTRHFRESMGRERLRRLIGPLNETAGVLVISALLAAAGGRILGGQWLQPEDFVRFLILLFGLLTPVVNLGKVQNDIRVAEGAATRVFDVMDTHFHIRQPENPLPLSGFSREIECRKVTLRYSPDREPALSDVSLTIHPGERILLVGYSGSGKSSLLNLLPRFFDPTAGIILLDGQDIRDYSLSDLRNLYGIVTQDVLLFHDTVYNNIVYNRQGVSVTAVREAARRAKADEFIESLPDGYETDLGNLGERLSGGQRQRISIARAMLNDPPILLLDEPTSSLDSDVAEEIMQILDTVSTGKTVIMATHNLSSIRQADRILFFSSGKLVGDGKHDQLYAGNQDYRALCDKQFSQ